MQRSHITTIATMGISSDVYLKIAIPSEIAIFYTMKVLFQRLDESILIRLTYALSMADLVVDIKSV
jgi:hypothetical protein